MRKRIFFVWTAVLSFLFAVAAISQGQDAAGSKDHPFFSRLPNFNIAAHETMELGRHSFLDGKGEDRSVEGRKIWMRYELVPGSPSPGVVGIIHHYAKAAEEVGGSTFESTARTLFLNFVKEGKEIWAEVSVGEEYYTLTIVEKPTQPEVFSPVQLGDGPRAAPTPEISGVSPAIVPEATGTHIQPGPSSAPSVPSAGPPSAPPGRAAPRSITSIAKLPDLAVAAVNQKYQRSLKAASPSPDIDVLIRNNGGDYAGPLKIHVRSHGIVPISPGHDPYPETNKTFNYERVEIPGGSQMNLELGRAIRVSSSRWGCRRQVVVTLDRKVHNDANPANNTLGTTFFEQTGIASELSPLHEVELKADSDGDWRRIRTDRTHRLRPGMYTVRFRLVSCSRTDQRYYLDMGKGSFQWVTVPAGGEASAEIRFEIPDKQKSVLPMKWYRPRWDEDWKDARTLFNFSYDTNP
jgi:hypothetical protein